LKGSTCVQLEKPCNGRTANLSSFAYPHSADGTRQAAEQFHVLSFYKQNCAGTESLRQPQVELRSDALGEGGRRLVTSNPRRRLLSTQNDGGRVRLTENLPVSV